MWGAGSPRTPLHLVPACLPFPCGPGLGGGRLARNESSISRLTGRTVVFCLVSISTAGQPTPQAPPDTPGGMGGERQTSVPHDVDFGRGPIPSGPCGPNLHQGMADVFWNRDFYCVLAGEVQRGSWLQVVLVQHLRKQGSQVQAL